MTRRRLRRLPIRSRRKFLVGSAAAGGGLAIGLHAAVRRRRRRSRSARPRPPPVEVNAWVVVKPDETCVIRIARSEMGQGTLTGLAQLVVEELECDWNKVATNSRRRARASRASACGASSAPAAAAASASREDYVRRGGAVARMMLLQAAADQWKVPVGELTVANGVITHAPTGRKTSYGKVARGGGEADAARSEERSRSRTRATGRSPASR